MAGHGMLFGISVLYLLSAQFSDVSGALVNTTCNSIIGHNATVPTGYCTSSDPLINLSPCGAMIQQSGYRIFSTETRLADPLESFRRIGVNFIRSIISNLIPTAEGFQCLCTSLHKIYQCAQNVDNSCTDATRKLAVNAVITQYLGVLTFYKSCNISDGTVDRSFIAILNNKENAGMVKCISGMYNEAKKQLQEALEVFKKITVLSSVSLSTTTVDGLKALTACRRQGEFMTIVRLASGCNKTVCKANHLQLFRKYINRVLTLPGKTCAGEEGQAESLESKGNKADKNRTTILFCGGGHLSNPAAGINDFQTYNLNGTHTFLKTENLVITGKFEQRVTNDPTKNITFLVEANIVLYGDKKDCGDKVTPVLNMTLKVGATVNARSITCGKNKRTIVDQRTATSSNRLIIKDQCSKSFALFRSLSTPSLYLFYVTLRLPASTEKTGFAMTGSDKVLNVLTASGRRRRRAISPSILSRLGTYDATSTNITELLKAMEAVTEDTKLAETSDKEVLDIAANHGTNVGIVILMALLSLLPRL